MQILPTNIDGAYLLRPEMNHDNRGAFGRLFCRATLAEAGLRFEAEQINLSCNPAVHTLRGMHFQLPPHAEDKIVYCVRGALFDVAIDLRPQSATFRAIASVELEASTPAAFLIPAGCAHGFLTLKPETDILYLMGQSYVPGAGSGIRWDDPAFDIRWPTRPALMSERDASWPDFAPSSDA